MNQRSPTSSPVPGYQAGQATVFVTTVAVALIAAVGLVYDGGRVLTARIQAIDEAQEAARAGAQGIDLTAYRRNGHIDLDPAQARAAARTYLVAAGYHGTVATTGTTVTVSVDITRPTHILPAIGLTRYRVHATATAQATHAVD